MNTAQDAEVAEFFATHRLRILRYLMGLYGCSEPDADDVVQETIVLIRQHWKQIRTYQKPEAYWYKIASRQYQRWQGERAREHAYPDPEEYLRAVADLTDGAENVNRGMVAMPILRELPLKQRQVFWLREAAGFSTEETAKIMSISAGTVKSQLHDAKEGLKKLLRGYGAARESDIR